MAKRKNDLARVKGSHPQPLGNRAYSQQKSASIDADFYVVQPRAGYRWDGSTFPAEKAAERHRQISQAVVFIALFLIAALIG